jgi:hypothetical protein
VFFVCSFLQPHANGESDLNGHGKFVGKPPPGRAGIDIREGDRVRS